MEQRGYKRQRQEVHESGPVMSPAYGCGPHAFNAEAIFRPARPRCTKPVRPGPSGFTRSQVRQSVRRNTLLRGLPSAIFFSFVFCLSFSPKRPYDSPMTVALQATTPATFEIKSANLPLVALL